MNRSVETNGPENFCQGASTFSCFSCSSVLPAFTAFSTTARVSFSILT